MLLTLDNDLNIFLLSMANPTRSPTTDIQIKFNFLFMLDLEIIVPQLMEESNTMHKKIIKVKN